MTRAIIRPTRRGLIIGIGASLLAAPAIVRASSLMPVKTIAPSPFNGWMDELRITYGPFSISSWVKRPGEIWHHWAWDQDNKGRQFFYVDGVQSSAADAPITINQFREMLGKSFS